MSGLYNSKPKTRQSFEYRVETKKRQTKKRDKSPRTCGWMSPVWEREHSSPAPYVCLAFSAWHPHSPEWAALKIYVTSTSFWSRLCQYIAGYKNYQWCGTGTGRIRIHLGPWIRIQGYKLKGKAEFNQQIFVGFFVGNFIFQVRNRKSGLSLRFRHRFESLLWPLKDGSN